MNISNYVQQLLQKKLDERRIIVWYDGEKAFGEFIKTFSAPNCHVVSAQESGLRARRKAEVIYRQINFSNESAKARANLLIYLPCKRSIREARQQDPFEVFAVAGGTFGVGEAEQLRSLAFQALPDDMAGQIERLFRESKPTLAMLDRLTQGAAYPLVKQILGTLSSAQVAVQILGDSQVVHKITGVSGCGAEVLRLLQDELGFTVPERVQQWETRRELLARYLFFSEFAFDLPGDLPPALSNLPCAAPLYQERIFAIAGQLRDTGRYRERYIELANQVEQDLNLPAHFAGITRLGSRDTFAFQEQHYMLTFAKLLASGEQEQARQIIDTRAASIWRHEPERAQIWKAATRCADLWEVGRQIELAWKQKGSSVSNMIRAYAAQDGFFDLDRRQRLMEQSVAECTECEALEEVISLCRGKYRQIVDAMQGHFLEQITKEGWPPDGLLRQSQIFDRFVAPALVKREKVAYILSDSLRFEMGYDLSRVLHTLGQVDIQPAAASLPTITSVGMAALMPGADGVLALCQVGEQLVPHLGTRPLKNSAARMKFLSEKFGDRVVNVEIGEFLSLSSSKKRKARLENADLVVVRDLGIDQMGENVSLLMARKYISDLLGNLKAAITQLIRLGYHYLVIVTDHGHLLFPDVLSGDVVSISDGNWLMRKRRSLLGSQITERMGNCVFDAAHIGIQGDVDELVVPGGFGLYAGGSGYFHSGLSLQECVLPVLTLRAKGQPGAQGRDELEIRYRRKKFTSRVIGLKIWYNSLVASSVRVKVEAFDGSSATARKVGEAADCDARDEVTHEVTLVAGKEINVPLLLTDDVGAEVEIRATDADAPVVWARLILKNEMLD